MATVTAMPLEVNESLWRMPLERYHAMIRSGVLSGDDRIELLEGVLVEKMSKNPAHRIATRKTGDALRAVLPAGWYVDEQAPVTTADSEPEPDISLMRGSTGDYADRHPGPADVALAVEVADSSVRRDRGIKKRIYARAPIATYWLLDLNSRTLEVYTQPRNDEYASLEILSATDHVTLTLNAEAVASLLVADLLP